MTGRSALVTLAKSCECGEGFAIKRRRKKEATWETSASHPIGSGEERTKRCFEDPKSMECSEPLRMEEEGLIQNKAHFLFR